MGYRCVLLDLGGVVFTGDDPLPGAIDAIARLHDAGLSVRFLTNTTRTSRDQLLAKLRSMGLSVAKDELFTPAIAARQAIAHGRFTPHLLVHPDLLEDFVGLPEGTGKAVVVGDAGDAFSYAALNMAFRALDDGAAFLALANNRSFREADGALSLDAGPFVAALSFAARRDPIILGKPDAAFFAGALRSADCTAADAIMIGDDVESDVGGALAAGINGLLVRTGKYHTGAESEIDPPPTAVANDLAAAVDWILAQ